jgi:hypothetical protein
MGGNWSGESSKSGGLCGKVLKVADFADGLKHRTQELIFLAHSRYLLISCMCFSVI